MWEEEIREEGIVREGREEERSEGRGRGREGEEEYSIVYII
jgi:hypothetical protein